MEPGRRNRVGSVIKGRWRLDRLLGSGAHAAVYEATHRNGHRVALKLLHAGIAQEESLRVRLLREAYVANSIGHPGVVRILDDDGTEDGTIYLVMELLEGESLELRRERANGKLPVEEAFQIALGVLDVIAAAHDKGVVHRDLKPENIF